MDEAIRALERAAMAGDTSAKEKLKTERARAGIPEPLAEVQEDIGAAISKIRSLEREFEVEGMKEFREYVEAIFRKEPSLQVISIRGYTPGFCDGDLCEHSQSVTIGPGGEEESPGEKGVAAEAATAYSRGLGEFEPVLNMAHGTNWQLKIKRDSKAGVSIKKERYECGY